MEKEDALLRRSTFEGFEMMESLDKRVSPLSYLVGPIFPNTTPCLRTFRDNPLLEMPMLFWYDELSTHPEFQDCILVGKTVLVTEQEV